MSLDSQDKTSLIKFKIEMAHESLNDAEFSIQNGKLRMAVNRLYYAIFYILYALAIKHDFKTSKHLTLMGWFNKNFVKAKFVDKRLSKIAKQAYDMRSKSDYGDYVVFSQDEVGQLLQDIKEFVAKVEELLKS
jgi:uncharacterized protein (UPF0332 family)